MSSSLHVIETTHHTTLTSLAAINALESGQIIFLPHKSMIMQENEELLLTPTILAKNKKNVSCDFKRQTVAGLISPKLHIVTQNFMRRYAIYAKRLVDMLLPAYSNSIQWGRTSYRPAEIAGRTTSKRKDDTRLHVDAFPATPVDGLRILRVFCNINPVKQPRVWHTGEPFADVINRFAPRISRYNYSYARLLERCKATKSLRTAYDHYMLQLHDRMKLDNHYQANVAKQRIDFPAHSTWMVFTDHVSHAALSGQYLLEQTFYLPVHAMKDQAQAPLSYWQKLKDI